MHDVPASLPALTRAVKLQDKAAKVGFDWPSLAPVFDKLKEELAELEQEVAGSAAPQAAAAETDSGRIGEEFGDLLFVVANVARHLQIDPEAALRAANQKFIRRFGRIEELLAAQGRTPAQSTLAEMDRLWDQAKAEERGRLPRSSHRRTGRGECAASPARLSWPSSLPLMAGSMRKRAVTVPLSAVSWPSTSALSCSQLSRRPSYGGISRIRTSSSAPKRASMAVRSASIPSPVSAEISTGGRSLRATPRSASLRAAGLRRSALFHTSRIGASAAAASMPRLEQHRLHVAPLRLGLGMGDVAHVQDEVGLHHLLERGAEGRHQRGRQVGDEAHRVGEDDAPAARQLAPRAWWDRASRTPGRGPPRRRRSGG